VRGAVERGKLTAEEADAALAAHLHRRRRRGHQTDVVIEAVPERIDLKITVFRDLDRACPEGTILASNSSGFPIAAWPPRPTGPTGWSAGTGRRRRR
jgi:3-hydroxybutyryl-CoA dehydrogenase